MDRSNDPMLARKAAEGLAREGRASGSLERMVVPRLCRALARVEVALMELMDACPEDGLRRETETICNAYAQRRHALEQLMATRHNDKVSDPATPR